MKPLTAMTAVLVLPSMFAGADHPPWKPNKIIDTCEVDCTYELRPSGTEYTFTWGDCPSGMLSNVNYAMDAACYGANHVKENWWTRKKYKWVNVHHTPLKGMNEHPADPKDYPGAWKEHVADSLTFDCPGGNKTTEIRQWFNAALGSTQHVTGCGIAVLDQGTKIHHGSGPYEHQEGSQEHQDGYCPPYWHRGTKGRGRWEHRKCPPH